VYCCVSSSMHPTAFHEMNEEEQLRFLKRSTLIEQLPTGSYSPNKKNRE
jgi:hypothetical protein